MQFVLRYWERQADGTEYKNGSRYRGAYSAHPDSLSGGEGLADPLPKNPTPLSALRASPRLSYPHSKISSDAAE